MRTFFNLDHYEISSISQIIVEVSESANVDLIQLEDYLTDTYIYNIKYSSIPEFRRTFISFYN